ncbi:hypothetical protein GGX14DRAFT_646173 [Mycena pura]|uniref:Uncharacterized protein n=1 Tax=Mycena pura TaxID=153505 RepID=A0AAD6Y863_9AGAR|nr:hypothetical protein GGX14DRAFT_646173 [Mycena pura]
MNVFAAESTAPEPARCTVSLNDLTLFEFADFQALVTGESLAVLGSLPTNLEPLVASKATESWECEGRLVPVAIELAHQKIIGTSASCKVKTAIVNAIGNPNVCSRGHLFAIFRLLKHYKVSQPSMVPLCTEHIGKCSSVTAASTETIMLVTSKSDPSALNPLKRRRTSEANHAPLHHISPTESQIRALHDASQQVQPDVGYYSDPDQWAQLPFPFVYENLPKDRFELHASFDNSFNTFNWMGREVFTCLVDAVARLSTDGTKPSAAFLGGPMGVGKSHLLATLTLYLRRQGKVVVYVPHCGDLLQQPVAYMAAALLCAFSGPSVEDARRRSEIRTLNNSRAIEIWCARQTAQGVCFHFVVDQLNGLLEDDLPHRKTGMTTTAQCTSVKAFLVSLYGQTICIRSSSANDQYGYGPLGRGQREQILDFSQRLSEAEVRSWMKHYELQLPKFEPEELEWFNDYAGGVFLFYPPLLQHSGTMFSDAWPAIHDSPIFLTTRENVQEFAAGILTRDNKNARQNYLAGVKAFVTGTATRDILERLIDHRYCFVDGGRGRVTCGLVRRELIVLLESHDRNTALSTEWLDDGLSQAITCPPALEFLVEKSIIATMLSGVTAPGLIRWPAVDKYLLPAGRALPHHLPSSLLSENGCVKRLLIVPEISNFKGIDCLFIELDNIAKKARLIPIQITLAEEHKDSAALFYAHWRKWSAWLDGYEISTAFLWIVDGLKPGTIHHTRYDTPAFERRMRTASRAICSYTEYFVHLQDVAPRVWEGIENARRWRDVEMVMDIC